MNGTTVNQGHEWRSGWRTAAAGFAGMALLNGVTSVLGVLIEPISAETGWPRSLIAAKLIILSLATLVLAPVAGRLIARFGVRRCAIACVASAVPALLGVAANGGSVAIWLATWTIFAAINVGLGPLMWTTAVSGLFDKARGLAIAVTLSGSGAAYVIVPIAVLVEGSLGWRAVYILLAGLFLVILLPATWFWFRSRADVDRADIERADPERADPERVVGHSPAGPERSRLAAAEGLSFAQAARTRQFWQLAMSCSLVAAVQGAVIINLVPLLSEGEGALDRTVAGSLTMLLGLFMVIGRLITGAALDRLPGLMVFASAMAIILAGAALASRFDGSLAHGAMISALLGFGAGGMTGALAYLTGRLFGLADYASIFGVMMGMYGVAFAIGPVAANHIRDTAGSYGPMFPAVMLATIAAIVLTLLIGKPPRAAAAG